MMTSVVLRQSINCRLRHEHPTSQSRTRSSGIAASHCWASSSSWSQTLGC